MIFSKNSISHTDVINSLSDKIWRNFSKIESEIASKRANETKSAIEKNRFRLMYLLRDLRQTGIIESKRSLELTPKERKASESDGGVSTVQGIEAKRARLVKKDEENLAELKGKKGLWHRISMKVQFGGQLGEPKVDALFERMAEDSRNYDETVNRLVYNKEDLRERMEELGFLLFKQTDTHDFYANRKHPQVQIKFNRNV